ncbi:hypothetical protein [Porphyromonas crevioricanis]|uniref:Uncharacterized protein n=1 Tax=Porphyromonas crevioricanis TaxID=393921 RepID=A0AB34PF64_9PORP|nr:hypothetical protein [Porphyromonas crevioricanis]KGN93880.1 hypothetical protein HQ38_07650 [Porphyromonas crevioricanis]
MWSKTVEKAAFGDFLASLKTPMNRAFREGQKYLLRKILLTQERTIFFSGENFCSLPREIFFEPQWQKREDVAELTKECSRPNCIALLLIGDSTQCVIIGIRNELCPEVCFFSLPRLSQNQHTLQTPARRPMKKLLGTLRQSPLVVKINLTLKYRTFAAIVGFGKRQKGLSPKNQRFEHIHEKR